MANKFAIFTPYRAGETEFSTFFISVEQLWLSSFLTASKVDPVYDIYCSFKEQYSYMSWTDTSYPISIATLYLLLLIKVIFIKDFELFEVVMFQILQL